MFVGGSVMDKALWCLAMVGLAAGLTGCITGRLPEVVAEVEATSLANVRTLNLFTPSLYGEEGKLFNPLLERRLRERMANILDSGARWTLTVVSIEYTTPHFKQKTPHYQLELEVELTDLEGKRGWHAVVGTPEIAARPEWSEARIREHLVIAAAEALVGRLPLGRIEMGEEKLR
jgi:hypothetical protein